MSQGVSSGGKAPREGQAANDPKEFAVAADEPLLPVEKRLMGWSLFVGLALLMILVWVSYRFFPG